ncbi:hypothetical protein NECAME_03888 [Necator americanus]|uniref:Uncharacterized protein n=1 Tax=Necator americanus TaxID=51031 RepID=W2SZC8_NECAM|nr:hypothetical protein NECAME_03888 [Necator americanus]ETN74973.1 hypothetical protein NECAME_03888 [Necator americanus]
MRRGGAPLHHGASVPTSLGLAFPACVTEALLQERDEMNKYTYFEVLFLGREGDSHIHEQRLRLLYRLASYALQFPVLQLYAQISLWLSKVGNSKPYAEELVAVLAEHYLKPADSIIYEYLLPLESSCPEFTVFFVVYATRFMPINRPMAAVFASYINRNPGYFLKGFRDSPHLADIFRLEVFEKMLNYLLEIEGEPSSDIEAMNYHTAVMVLLDKWSSTIRKPLDINLLFDPSIRWSRFRSDALCVVGSKSPAAGKMVAKEGLFEIFLIAEPLPVYVPKPAIGERNWLGSVKAPPEQFPHEPYRPGKSDLLSFLGAGLGVALTVLAVTFYNDIFGESPVKKVTLKDAHHHELPKESSQVAQIEEAEEVKAVEHDALLSHENVDNHPTRSTEQLVPKLSSERNEESGEVRTVESTQEQSSHKETHEDISSREQKPPYASEEGSSPEDKPSHFSTESSSPEHQSFHVHVEPALLSEDVCLQKSVLGT